MAEAEDLAAQKRAEMRSQLLDNGKLDDAIFAKLERELLRAYEPSECGRDGYPHRWHSDIKDLIRFRAGNRCVRCGHPYQRGSSPRGEWTPCDQQCTHDGEGCRLPDGKIATRFAYAAGELVSRGFQIEAQWRILTVHHLDGDKRNCRWWNLASLCQRCHLRIQTTVKMAQTYPFEHSSWFKPYAAGYYAFSYLKEDIDRDEAVRRLDDLLALEAIGGRA